LGAGVLLPQAASSNRFTPIAATAVHRKRIKLSSYP